MNNTAKQRIFNISFLILLLIGLTVNIYAQTKGDSLIVLIGEIISVEMDWRTETQLLVRNDPKDEAYFENLLLKTGRLIDTAEIHIPGKYLTYKSKFKVIELLNGFYNQDTIEFESYESHGPPDHSKNEYSLLFIRPPKNGKFLYQEYYLSHPTIKRSRREESEYIKHGSSYPVSKTKEGRWVTGYLYPHYPNKCAEQLNSKLEKLNFEEKLIKDVSRLEKYEIEKEFPSKYYRLEGGKTISTHGCYIEELIQCRLTEFQKRENLRMKE